ncbi:MAG: RNA polymerase sigma factor [bacterium]
MRTPTASLLANDPSLNPGDAYPDDVLAARLRNGDTAAMGSLFRRHAHSLIHLATALTGSPADAEDVVQDVFVGLQLALRGYVEQGAFAAWLRSVTIRTALANQRRAARRREVSPDGEMSSVEAPSNDLQRLLLRDAVVRLPDDMRVVFVLKVAEGYSHAEIASLLGIRAGTSEVRLFRAIRLLRALLAESAEC